MIRIAVCFLSLVACSIETYAVDVSSDEVRESSIRLQLDRQAAEAVLRAEIYLASPRGDACPVIADDVALMLTTDAGNAELAVSERGGGSYGVRCAIKCSDPIAFETRCGPVRAELRGPSVAALASSSHAFIQLQDAGASLGVGLAGDAIAPRTVQLDVETVRVDPADAPIYSFSEVPFVWSHADQPSWVSEFSDGGVTRDGEFSAFNLVLEPEPTADRVHAFSVRNDAGRGVRRVVFAASAPIDTCELGSCPGIEHVIASEIRVTDR